MHENKETIEDITKGVEITTHYLDAKQEQFKLFRHSGRVYAVKYDEENNPLQAVEMWSTQKNNKEATDKNTTKNISVGSGKEGQVILKDKGDGRGILKAYKTLNSDTDQIHGSNDHIVWVNITQEAKKKNISLLEQKFLLVNNKIDNHFVMGLWNIKRKDIPPEFVMPAVKEDTQFEPENIAKSSDDNFNNFIIALRKLNQLGFAHPDYSASGLSLNAMKDASNQIIKLIDLHTGFDTITETTNSSDSYDITLNNHRKNQWLYACNYDNHAIQEWEEKNPHLALSDYPHELIKLAETQESKIYLPSEILAELKTYVLKNPETKLPEKPSDFKESYQEIEEELISDSESSQLGESFQILNCQVGAAQQLIGDQETTHYHPQDQMLIQEVSNNLKQLQKNSEILFNPAAKREKQLPPPENIGELIKGTNEKITQLRKSPNPNCCKLAAGIGLIFAGICTTLASIAAIVLSLPTFGLTAKIGAAGIVAGIAMIGAGAKLTHDYKKQLKDLKTAELPAVQKPTM